MKRLLLGVYALVFSVSLWGGDQLASSECGGFFRSDESLDSSQVGELRLNVGGLLFFRDNEFSTSVMDGYTLPGFKLCPTVSYMPSRNVKAELGVSLTRFWGTDRYPNMAYRDIASWTGGERSDGFHVVPFFRVQMATDFGLQVVLGSIYGGANHRLLMPLYEPELNLTADPETGAQVLYSNRWLDADMWVNWESFIYRGDTHQEEFVFGISSRIKYNSERSRLHFYTPVQLLAQHRGGEIDTITSHSVQTLMNGAVGFGARWSINHRRVKSASLELDYLGYYQQAGELWAFDNGNALYLHGNLDVWNTRFKLGYFYGDKFISMFGYPLFGCVSTKNPGMTYDKPSTVYVGFEYAKEFAPGFSLGVNVDIYERSSCYGTTGEGVREKMKGSTSFAAGLCMKINPSFLLYKKK
ncbi:hypothetical protein [uncultured Muribaculum sp.]|uniref:hypothetical protein n=1 Tax=uncultured Muribaculum sp. TaxID=1918613 RepID=UPI0025944806|nr:hypothetical protein [uncultured Muribaculum sp.]